MYAKVMMVAALLAAGGGCATTPADNSSALEVSAGARASYWTPKDAKINVGSRSSPGQINDMASLVVVAYLIDSKGEVRDATVVRTEPASADPSWALQAIRAYSFVPTPSNASRQPIRTQQEITLR